MSKYPCFLHGKDMRDCGCDYHCTGCAHGYGKVGPDCCTCCRATPARKAKKKPIVR